MKRKSVRGALVLGVIAVCAIVCMGCATNYAMEKLDTEPDFIMGFGNEVVKEKVDGEPDFIIIRTRFDAQYSDSIDVEKIYENAIPRVWYRITVKGTSAEYFIMRQSADVTLVADNALLIYRRATEAEKRNILAERQEAALAEQRAREQEERAQQQQEAALAARQQAEAEANRQQQPPDDAFTVTQNADNTVTITGYKGTALNIIIPDTLYGLKVGVIGGNAFEESGSTDSLSHQQGLRGVVIPDTVTTIGGGAFSRNSRLRSVIIGNAVRTIGSRAFLETSLSEVVIPDSVTSIGQEAFKGVYTVANLGRGTFTLKGYLTKVQLGRGLKTISINAFANNKITEVVIPNGVTSIGEGAFANNEITEVVIPNGVTSIGEGAFTNNKITKVVILNGVTYIGRDAFGNQLTELVIPPSLAIYEAIAENAFKDCPLTRITIPANMDETNMRSFEENLVNFWKNQNKAAGTYVKNGPIWTRE